MINRTDFQKNIWYFSQN